MAHPVNHYGLSKWKSELMITESNVTHAILRTILVYGLVDGNDRSNIVLWVKNSLENKKEIQRGNGSVKDAYLCRRSGRSLLACR